MLGLLRRFEHKRQLHRRRAAGRFAGRGSQLFVLAGIILVVSFMYPPLIVALLPVVAIALGFFLLVPLVGLVFGAGFL